MGNFRNRAGRADYRAAFGARQRAPGALPTRADARKAALAEDALMGFAELPPGAAPRTGWLVNMVPGTVEEATTGRAVQAVDMFFLADPGDARGDFRASVIARPYMYLAVGAGMNGGVEGGDRLREAEVAVRRMFPDYVADVVVVELEDISMPNHLASDAGRKFLKVITRTTGELYNVREELRPIIERNAERRTRAAAVEHVTGSDGINLIEDMREFDVAPVNRVAIDKEINVGFWYRVTPGGSEDGGGGAHPTHKSADDEAWESMHVGDAQNDPDINDESSNDFASAKLTKVTEIVERANPVVLAYDIECTKQPLKFPDAEAGDKVMMISWMVDGVGFLGINREAVSEDVEDFEYAPHDDFRGEFTVYNEPNEKALLERFFAEVRIAAPRVFVTFNGDYFDWPFVEKRAARLGLDMGEEIGMRTNGDEEMTKITKGRAAIHMDVFHWVNRDSYLPQGSRGLKAVTRTLLGFEPEEIPPEEMMAAAMERPIEMARYSVSDAVCTYYLYMKYVHPFIFSLCNIIPLNPDDVLRKGSGTLCEMLLMCQAFNRKIVAPNKFNGTAIGKLTEDGHVLESETYVGGHVEALRTGIYRSDLPLDFKIDLEALDDLEKTLDDTLKFAITVEGGLKMEDVTNYDEVRADILKGIQGLRDKPECKEKPLIYHLDVSAMYPNIILTNRLQPHAIVKPAQCASCDFNGMSECQRDMEWTWRGEFFPASRGEAEMVQRRTAQEQRETEEAAAKEAAAKKAAGSFHENGDDDQDERNGRHGGRGGRGRDRGRGRGRALRSRGSDADREGKPSEIMTFDNEDARKDELFRKRLKDYCRTNYRKTQETRVVTKQATVCQRENPFYVDTVRAFRDRRYEYKAMLKRQKRARAAAKESGDKAAIEAAENMVVIYDSLQLAHKCILNSFYGYVMRRGARWFSMEMAGIVTNTGALIIRRAREFIERVGLPLELDTDGIWCVLPVTFPENFSFTTKSGKKHTISYICSVFNADVAANFTNHQYQDLKPGSSLEYERKSECSIMFEVDGPYRAMVLPASLEEGKSIKKRYAVFNDDGSLAELKGFEIKRRGELKLIKEFQGEIFNRFLEGGTIDECYGKVGDTCNKWLDILTSKGDGMTDTQLLELLVEQNNMSKALDEYLAAKQKSCAITCAKRMKMFLGEDIAKDKGLATMYIVSRKPEDDQVTERAIPVKVFDIADSAKREQLLRKWTKTAREDEDLQLRDMIDWKYYQGRLANAILKIVSIPAALQAVENPVPRIEYPPWLVKKCRELKDKRKQRTVTSFFSALPKGAKPASAPFATLQDAANDTEKLGFDDIEDMPLTSWTAAKRATRRAQAVVARRNKEARRQTLLAKKNGGRIDRPTFRSKATDPAVRAHETRQALLKLVRQAHPNKRTDYSGWLRHAKKIWNAQRAVRVHRYAAKRSRDAAALDAIGDDSEDEDEDAANSREENGAVGGSGYTLLRARGLGGQAPRRRQRTGTALLQPDYAPANFVADLRVAAATRSMATFFSKKITPLIGPGVLWQNVAVTATPRAPGEYRLWVLPMRKEGSLFVAGQLHCVPLHVNRVLHFNSRVDGAPVLDGAAVEEVRGVILPRSRPALNLYRIELPEGRFLASDKELSSALTDAASVDSLFGSKTPLEYEAIVTLGALCAPRKSVTSRNSAQQLLRKGVTLDDLIARDANSVPYLRESFDDSAEPVLNQAFLYGSHASDRSSRAMYVVVAPAAKQVFAVVVTPAGRASFNMARVWKRIVEERSARAASQGTANRALDMDEELGDHEEAGDGEQHGCEDFAQMLPGDVKFSVRGVRTRPEAWSELSRMLSNLRHGGGVASKGNGTGQRTVILAQWPALDASSAADAMFGSEASAPMMRNPGADTGCLEDCVPAVEGFPVVHISSNAADGNYLPVGWEVPAVTVAMSRFAEMGNWLTSQLTFSRFAGIPLGNISVTDVHQQALDVLMGRELSNRGHVLWASESPQPDLGGLEEEDNIADADVTSIPEFVTSGSYRTVCIDTELSNLAIATILSSTHVNQIEGTDLAFDAAANTTAKGVTDNPKSYGSRNENDKQTAKEGQIGGKNAAPLDEMASSAPAFRVLKDLVTNWEKMASSSSCHQETAGIARGLLDHVHRWTRSEASLLYDPALARFLGWIIRKVFRQLISELQSLGATIVYASLSRLILATPKTHTLDGLRYAGFLEKTIKAKPLFRHVQFSPLLGIYSSLLFVDRFNYGALPAPEEESILNGSFGTGAGVGGENMLTRRRTHASRDIPYVRMMWDMARYLPTPVAVLWSQVIEEFIRRPMVQRLRNEELEDEAAIENGGADAEAGAEAVAERRKKRDLQPRGDGFAQEVQTLTAGLTAHLLEKVHQIREKTPTLAFPIVPTILTTTVTARRNPALEFVRSLCHVMSLDVAATEEVSNMRRSLLRLLGVREFSKDAQFVDPALPVPLHDVICTYCNAVVDLDIARDARLWSQKNDDRDETHGSTSWLCEYCAHPYDTKQIELDLVRVVQKLYTTYQVQDLTCRRCRMVKRENMSMHCACSGAPFELSLTREAFQRQLHALKSVAEFHKFEFLRQTVSWISDCTGAAL